MQKKIIIIFFILIFNALPSCRTRERKTPHLTQIQKFMKLVMLVDEYNNYQLDLNRLLFDIVELYGKKYGNDITTERTGTGIVCKQGGRSNVFKLQYNDIHDFSKTLFLSFGFFEKSAKPGFIKNSDSILYLMGKCLVDALHNNSHLYYPGDPQAVNSGKGRIGIICRQNSNKAEVASVLLNGPAYNAGVRKGDIISSINDKSLEPDDISDIQHLLNGEAGSHVELGLIGREGKEKIVRIERMLMDSAPYEKKLSGDVLYLKLPVITKTYSAIFDGINPTVKGLILDLRDNSGGLLNDLVFLSGYFKENATAAVVKSRKKTFAYDTQKSKYLIPDMNIVVLINEGTSSGAEVFAAFLKKERGAVLIGNRTLGTNTIHTYYVISNDISLKLSSGKIFASDGIDFENDGIKPDVYADDESDLLRITLETIKNKALHK